jgi:hypothetical protein
MAKSVNKVIREGYNRLKKTMEKMMNPKKQDAMPSLILQPVKTKNN